MSESEHLAQALPHVQPLFSDKVAVVFATDKNYWPYFCVALQSLLSNTSADKKYDICVLTSEPLSFNRRGAKFFARENVSIRFVTIDERALQLDLGEHVNQYYSTVTYYRFFIPEIFAAYAKVIYLDTDIVVLGDIAELAAINIGRAPLAACRDAVTYFPYSPEWVRYITRDLCLACERYFCAGVAVFNVPVLREQKFLSCALAKLAELGAPKAVDQDVMNCLYTGTFYQLPLEWDVTWGPFLTFNEEVMRDLSPADQLEFAAYARVAARAKIIHYSTGVKPWAYPGQPLADLWWAYARQTPNFWAIVGKNKGELAKRWLKKLMPVAQ
ncbi:glycosyltransferase family 8 protein [bacterium]|nr:glycosyltransferase family 8 protein [bacterium]